MTHYEPLSPTSEQTVAIQTAAAQIQPCWRQTFLRSVADNLQGLRYRHVTDDDVVKAIKGVEWALTIGLQDDD